jgi:hypothetical protein
MADDCNRSKFALGLGVAGLVFGLVAFWNSLAPPEPVAAATEPPPNPNAGWLKGSDDEKFTTVERHLRGLDVSMAEIGYRYGELLVAGKERNWDYAKYQTDKIDLSLRLAVERRPKRAKSAEPFLVNDLPAVLDAVKAKDAPKLDAALERLHAGCVECHKKEDVLYFKSAVDRIKQSADR